MSFVQQKSKVFCIGQNKTGTTSIEAVLKKLGYKMGDQAQAELLLYDWKKRDFNSIIKFCESAEAFQDIPFSLDYTYQILDYAFPNSKFILTIRDSEEGWYNSITRFHTKVIGKNRLPLGKDLKKFNYRKEGFMWDAMHYIYGVDDSDPYNFKFLTMQYRAHNRNIRQYFKFRQDDFLVLNLAKQDAMKRLYEFLGYDYLGDSMPHLNKSR